MWTALILAGQRPGIDALAAAFGETKKALIRVDGVPMLARVARTLLDSPDIARVVILAQDAVSLAEAPGCEWLAREPRIGFAASGGGIATSVLAIGGTPAAPWPVLVTTADHPLLTTAMIAAFIAGSADTDVAVGVVERRVVLAAYPANRRTWLRFRGGAWSGANLFALQGGRARPALEMWAGVERDRKSGWRLIGQLGPLLLAGAVLRLLTLDGAVARLGTRLGLRARAVALRFAEAAIDVDKPSDHQLAELILRARA
ncbi:NTP transferase domain-containing protein [Sphingosinicellaceae bacterium]|nr:NTP transferase domain-containing protein [Sphingosinicellaceae bacterium]